MYSIRKDQTLHVLDTKSEVVMWNLQGEFRSALVTKPVSRGSSSYEITL